MGGGRGGEETLARQTERERESGMNNIGKQITGKLFTVAQLERQKT